MTQEEAKSALGLKIEKGGGLTDFPGAYCTCAAALLRSSVFQQGRQPKLREGTEKAKKVSQNMPIEGKSGNCLLTVLLACFGVEFLYSFQTLHFPSIRLVGRP